MYADVRLWFSDSAMNNRIDPENVRGCFVDALITPARKPAELQIINASTTAAACAHPPGLHAPSLCARPPWAKGL